MTVAIPTAVPRSISPRRFSRAYLAMNLLFYGSIAAGMAISVARPEIQHSLMNQVQRAFKAGAMSPVTDAYTGRHFVRAAVITFGVNLLFGTIVAITVPSLLIPLSGILVGVYRGVLWGIIFAPIPNGSFGKLLFHWPVLLMEGQGYALAMLGVYILWRGVATPGEFGASSRVQGYLRGLRILLRLYPWIALILAVAAVYESAEVVWLIPRRQ